MQVDGAQTIITFLGVQQTTDTTRWEHAVADQMGVIGSDFRGPEEIGSAAFQRASHSWYIPDNINFWHPQKQPRDHRPNPYFKRTLVGKVIRAEPISITGKFKDHDVCIDIVPNDKYMYLITDGHRREYTDIMSVQWTASRHESGQPSCDDEKSIAEFRRVECEVQPDADPNSGTARKFTDLVHARSSPDLAAYGVWIYDKGHCCHPELHPAEQFWWRDDISPSEKRYTFSLFVDASKRFWWRDQMDDGSKLKPWGAPPITGTFAIAFETELGKPALKFEVANIDHWNVVDVPNGDQIYNLVYQNNVLVTFIPHNSAFKVSFEGVGLAGSNKIRGFLVLETTVGRVVQTKTRINLSNHGQGFPSVSIDIPEGTDVNSIDQRFEREVFRKEEGRYMFTVTQTNPQAGRGRGSIWTSDFVDAVLHITPIATP
jgi:hypothetical protein